MGTSESEGWIETVEEEFIETLSGRMFCWHPRRTIMRPEGRREEASILSPMLRIIAEIHNTDMGVHIYTVELIDPRCFSNPLVFDVAFSGN